jgi:hypothetical protein
MHVHHLAKHNPLYAQQRRHKARQRRKKVVFQSHPSMHASLTMTEEGGKPNAHVAEAKKPKTSPSTFLPNSRKDRSAPKMLASHVVLDKKHKEEKKRKSEDKRLISQSTFFRLGCPVLILLSI